MAEPDDPPFRKIRQPEQDRQPDPNIQGRWHHPTDPPRMNEYSQMTLVRHELARKVAKAAPLFDAAVAAEAARLGLEPAISAQFAEAVAPGLKKRGIKKAGRERIQASVRRLKKI
jgi:hypothetical protein